MKYILAFFFIISVQVFSQEINEKLLKKHVYHLADDNLKGRGTGSKENTKAAKYIAKEFKKLNLKPLGNNGFYQNFTAKVKKVVVNDSLREAKNIIGFLDNKANKTIVIGAHYDHLGEGKQGSSLFSFCAVS